MEIDQHLIWLLGAIKACISDDVDEKKLNKNISDCLVRVKSACSNGNKDQTLEDFKVKVTLVLLLCSPSVRDIPVIQNSKDFQSVFLTFPVLKESVFFSVVRNQKLFRFLDPLLSYLPPSTLFKLIQEYFTCTSEVTPVTLAITLELVKALVSSVRNAPAEIDCEKESSEVFKSVLKFFSLKNVVGGSSAQVKSSAYFFMYLCECTFFLVNSSLSKYKEQQKIFKVSQVWTDLWKVNGEDVERNVPIAVDVLKSFIQMCQENVKAVSVDIWMDWSEAILPASVTVHRKSVTAQIKPHQNTIQSVICNIAFDILRTVESHSGMKDILYDSKDLVQFFKQVAADPDYDPDHDLSRDQLLSEINLKDGRHEKLLGILLEKDDVFTSEECIDCLMTHSEGVDNIVRCRVLVRLIRYIKEKKDYNKKSVEMVLKMVEDIPAAELLPVIEENLSSGKDEILRTPDFHQQMTSVFNQLTSADSSKNSTKHVWLCLQSGETVVSEAVRLPIAFPGLVNVMVQALTCIPQVCQALGKSDVSVIVNVLQERQMAGLHGREERDFGNLVKGLIKANILNVTDVLHLLVQPFLKFSCHKDLVRLDLPIELLKSIIDHDTQAVIKPGTELVSLILMLAHIIDTTAVLHIQNISVNLKLRTGALVILRSITQTMINDLEKYERDISVLKQIIVKYKLHPRSFLPLAELLDCEEQVDKHVDCLLLMISKMQFQQWEGKPLSISSVIDIPKKLSQASREEWIRTLLQLLPHCSEEEWVIAVYITHKYLKCGRMALHTMVIFQKVLYLANMQFKALTDNADDLEKETAVTSICLQHCFKCFANASMVYLEELMEGLPFKKRFNTFCSIFRWWCQVLPLYRDEQEVPALFLMQLVTAIEEIINSNKLIVVEQEGVGGGQAHLQPNGKITNTKAKKKQKDHSMKNGITQEAVKLVNGEVDFHAKCDRAENDRSDDVATEMSMLQIDPLKPSEVQKEVDNSLERLAILASNGIHGNEIDKESSCKESSNSVQKTASGDEISKAEFRKQIEQISLNFLKFIPLSNLASSVAGKLKNLHEKL